MLRMFIYLGIVLAVGAVLDYLDMVNPTVYTILVVAAIFAGPIGWWQTHRNDKKSPAS